MNAAYTIGKAYDKQRLRKNGVMKIRSELAWLPSRVVVIDMSAMMARVRAEEF